jgi:hypothetical protein
MYPLERKQLFLQTDAGIFLYAKEITGIPV